VRDEWMLISGIIADDFVSVVRRLEAEGKL
jgi:hypothetical protein